MVLPEEKDRLTSVHVEFVERWAIEQHCLYPNIDDPSIPGVVAPDHQIACDYLVSQGKSSHTSLA